MTNSELTSILAADLSEHDLQANVVAAAKMQGWWVMAVRDSRGTEPGWPDLTLIRGGRLMYRELKSETGKLRPAQRRVYALLVAAGADVAVWQPRHWYSGAIDEDLR